MHAVYIVCVLHVFVPVSLLKYVLSIAFSGRLEFSLVSDWVQMMLCMAHVHSANKLIKDYNMIVGDQLLLCQKDGNNKVNIYVISPPGVSVT